MRTFQQIPDTTLVLVYNWDENKHPRDKKGRFTSGRGGSGDARKAVDPAFARTRQAIVRLDSTESATRDAALLRDRIYEQDMELRKLRGEVWTDATFADYVWRHLSLQFYSFVYQGQIGRAAATALSGLYLTMRWVYRKIRTAGAYKGVKWVRADSYPSPLQG